MGKQQQQPPKKAETIEDIWKTCRPAPLDGEALKVFFVETDSARDPFRNTRAHLADIMKKQPDARILFYGHRGSGKSTELNRLLADIGDRFFPVKFSILDAMSPVAARAEDLILVIAEQVFNKAEKEGFKLSQEMLQCVWDYFSETVLTTKKDRDACIGIAGGVKTDNSIWGKLAGLFAEFRSEIKMNAHSDETKIATLRKRPSDLLVQANTVIGALRKELPKGKRLLIVVEDLDKLDMKQARDIFINHVNLLTGIRTDIIYTIPIFLFHSPDVNAFKPNFDAAVSLPMIKVSEPPNQKSEGFEIVKRIVLQRIAESLITEEALTCLIENTGGVLRHVFDVLNTVSVMKDVKSPLERLHIEYGLRQLKKELWTMIALPYEDFPGCPKSVDELYDCLEKYAVAQKKGQRVLPRADAVHQILMKSCALVEYNGEGWLGVHPLVIENLKILGRIS